MDAKTRLVEQMVDQERAYIGALELVFSYANEHEIPDLYDAGLCLRGAVQMAQAVRKFVSEIPESTTD